MKIGENITTFLLTACCFFPGTGWVSGQSLEEASNPAPKSNAQITTPVSVELIKKHIVKLDSGFQQAVKVGDTRTIDRIVSDDFVLVNGRGQSYSKADLLGSAREGKIVYERQEDSEQTVRVWGDTAIITALLWAKGTKNGEAFDYKVWFSDVYKSTPTGWRYVFAQVSLRLPSQQ